MLVIKCYWEEYKKGWGTRPNGYSLHLTIEDRNRFIKAYNDTLPETCLFIYERPESLRVETAVVDEEMYEKIKNSNFGLRFY